MESELFSQIDQNAFPNISHFDQTFKEVKKHTGNKQ